MLLIVVHSNSFMYC